MGPMPHAEKRVAWIPVALAVGFLLPIVFDGEPMPFVLGLPLNFAWCLFMVLVTSAALGFAYRRVRSDDA